MGWLNGSGGMRWPRKRCKADAWAAQIRFGICLPGRSPRYTTSLLPSTPFLLDCDGNIDTMEKRARLTVDLHNGTARNRFTDSRRCRGEVVRVARVLCGDGPSTSKWKRFVQRRRASG